MSELQQIEQEILEQGKVTGVHLDKLREKVYAEGVIGRAAADSLVELYKRVQQHTPAFEQFFYGAVKDHILADGRVDGDEVGWIRQMLAADGRFSDEERKFLRALKGEAAQVGPEFEKLFAQCMKQPHEQHTCR